MKYFVRNKFVDMTTNYLGWDRSLRLQEAELSLPVVMIVLVGIQQPQGYC